MTKIENPIKIGIAGTGWVARMRHLPSFRRNKRASVVALYNPDAQLAEKAERELGVAVYTSYETFLSKIDAVVICTPPSTHVELAEQALHLGKHVLSEKPFTVDVAEGKRLIHLADQKKLTLMPAHNFLFGRAMQKATQVIDSGTCGEVISALAIQWSSWNRKLPSWYDQLPGGLFFDEGPHLLYLLEAFIGKMEVQQSSVVSHPIDKNGHVFERYNAELKGIKGSGMLSAWYGAPTSEWAIVVAFQKKTILLDIFRDTCIVLDEEKNRTAVSLLTAVAKVDLQIWSSMFKWILSRYTKGAHLFGADTVAQHFLHAIQTGSEPAVSAQDGVRIVEMLHAIIGNAKNLSAEERRG